MSGFKKKSYLQNLPEKFDCSRSDWINHSQSHKFTNWIHELDQISPDEFLSG